MATDLDLSTEKTSKSKRGKEKQNKIWPSLFLSSFSLEILKTPMPRKPAIAVMLASQESMLCIFKSRLATVQDLTFWQRICWRTSNTNIIFKRRSKRGVLQSLDFCEMLYVLKVENVRHSVFFRSVFAEFWKNVFKWRCCVGKRYVSFFLFFKE